MVASLVALPGAVSGQSAMAEAPAACRVALAAVAAGELAAFAGLPPGCTEADAAASFGAPRPGEGEASLGTDHVSARYRVHATARGTFAVHVVGGALVLITSEDVQLTGAWESALGKPDGRLDVALGRGTSLKGAESVWASKGVAAIRSSTGALLQLALFSPTTVARYRSALRPSHAVRR